MSLLIHSPKEAASSALNADAFQLGLGSIASDELSVAVPEADFSTRRARTTRIFQIGFNKCGTHSLYRFLQRSGIAATRFNRGQLATNFRDNLAAGLKPLAGEFDKYVAFTDIVHLGRDEVIEGIHYFRDLYAYYPNSYFILNTRDKAAWLRDRLKQGEGAYARRYGAALNLRDETEVVERWSQDWDSHHQAVIDYFADKPGRLLVYDINAGKPAALTDFLAPDFATRSQDFHYEPEDEEF